MLKGGRARQHGDTPRDQLREAYDQPEHYFPMLLLREPPAAHQERFQHVALAPDRHTHSPGTTCPTSAPTSSSHQPPTHTQQLDSSQQSPACIPSHLTLAWASCCRTKLSADSLSLAIRVSHVSFTSVRISSALGMLSEALEEREDQNSLICYVTGISNVGSSSAL